MPTREDLLSSVVSRSRLEAARREHDAFLTFCACQGIPVTPEALTLYLTFLLDGGSVNGRMLRTKLQLLDLVQRMSGEQPWSKNPSIGRYLRGMHKSSHLGGAQRGDPLYQELVHAMVDATMRLEYEQARAQAIILTANATLWPSSALARLRWRHVRFCNGGAIFHLPEYRHRPSRYAEQVTVQPRTDDLCPVTALRYLKARQNTPPLDGLVFRSKQGPCDRNAVRLLVNLLPSRTDDRFPHLLRLRTGGTPLRRILLRVTTPRPVQIRDRALLLIGYGAALRLVDAMALRRSHVTITTQGLVLDMPKRPRVTGTPASPDVTYDPVTAWVEWLEVLDSQYGADPDCPAFPHVFGHVIRPVPVADVGLNFIVHQRAANAGLKGDYTFTSLRAGFIRTSLRAQAPVHAIAHHAGCRTLQSMARHQQREQLLQDNVVDQLGL